MFKKILIPILFFPSLAFALPVNSYVTQGATISNFTNQRILVSDPEVPQIQNYPVESLQRVSASFPSVQFTQVNGQTFSHTIKIYSGSDSSFICSVVSNLHFTATSFELNRPTTSDETHCVPSSYMTTVNGNTIYGFAIEVR